MLKTLLADIDPEELRDRHWERAALALPANPARFTSIGFSLDELLDRLAVLRPDLTQQLIKAQGFDRAGRHVEICIDGRSARECFAAGMTVCVGSVERFLPTVARFAEELRRSLGFAGEVSLACYWSPDQAGFGLHFDDRAVAICQLAGTKRWWHGRTPAVAEPRCNLVAGHAEAERQFRQTHPRLELPTARPDQLAMTELVPGALLYLPAGTWHRTAAQGESLALTIRFLPLSRKTLLTRALERALEERSDLRRGLPLRLADADDHVTDELLERQLVQLRRAVDALTVADLRREAETIGHVSPAGAPARPLAEADRLRVEDAVRVVEADGEVVIVSRRGSFRAPRDSERFVRSVIGRRSFAVGEADAWAPEGTSAVEVREALLALLGAGILAHEVGR